jgi:hypothetical protein
MPARLAGIREGVGDIQRLAHDVELMIARLRNTALCSTLVDTHTLDLALFDLKMIEAGIVHSARLIFATTWPPQNLVQLVNAFAKAADQPPTLTYEELVLINPPQDRRTFTTGRVGQSETDFYEKHRIIEAHMDETLKHFWRAIDILAQQGEAGVDEASLLLQHSLAYLHPIVKYARILGMNMPKEDFTTFRTYFENHPLRKTKGASGAFSATIPTADLLLGGENLAEDHLRYLHDNMQYFPRRGREDIRRALALVKEGLSLNSLYQSVGKPEELGAILQKLSWKIHDFRTMHYLVVKHQLLKVITGESSGTSGEKGEFLERRKNTHHITLCSYALIDPLKSREEVRE